MIGIQEIRASPCQISDRSLGSLPRLPGFRADYQVFAVRLIPYRNYFHTALQGQSARSKLGSTLQREAISNPYRKFRQPQRFFGHGSLSVVWWLDTFSTVGA